MTDCTVKVWDLSTGQETVSLGKHNSYVRKVTFCPEKQLIFTTYQSVIKVCGMLWVWLMGVTSCWVWLQIWDLRSGTSIKAFGPPPWSGGRSSDTLVQDLLVPRDGRILFSASGTFVNVWDLAK